MPADPISLYDRLMAVKPPGVSPTGWAERAGYSRQLFTDIRRRGNANHQTIERLLDAIGLTFAQFEAGLQQPNRDAPPPSAARSPVLAFQGQERPRDVPIVGTAECGDVDFRSDGEMVSVETMGLDLDEIIDHVRRPMSLDNRRDVYAIYFRGHSMAPRYEDGEIAYVDPRRPPARLDYVIVQLREPVGDGERITRVLAKRLVRNTPAFIELEQYSPPAIFRVPKAQVAHIHRIMPWDELVAF